jgi:ornithine cyclodeaminase/alanine dehydrogenase-like protein (mu-crystallin family)
VTVDPLRYLDAATVERLLPAAPALVELAELALRSLGGGAEMPPKAVLDGGPAGSFAQALPARLRAAAVPGDGAAHDLLGLKWIAGSAANRAAGLPAMTAVIVLNDPVTGLPQAILEGDAITAARTAALSAVAVRLLLRPVAGRRVVVVLVGAGVQARAHARLIAAAAGELEVVVHDRHPDRAAALVEALRDVPGIGAAMAVDDPRRDLRRADVIVTATTVGASEPVLRAADLGGEALVLPVDYAAYVTADVARSATAFVVDDRDAFAANRASGRLAGWPDPTATFAELLLAPAPRPAGLVVALHQGPGVADLIVADAVLQRAILEGAGQQLER